MKSRKNALLPPKTLVLGVNGNGLLLETEQISQGSDSVLYLHLK